MITLIIDIRTMYGNCRTFQKDFKNMTHFENWSNYSERNGHKVIGHHNISKPGIARHISGDEYYLEWTNDKHQLNWYQGNFKPENGQIIHDVLNSKGEIQFKVIANINQ